MKPFRAAYIAFVLQCVPAHSTLPPRYLCYTKDNIITFVFLETAHRTISVRKHSQNKYTGYVADQRHGKYFMRPLSRVQAELKFLAFKEAYSEQIDRI